MNDFETQVYVLEEREDISDSKAKIRSKRTLTGKYYAYLLRWEPLKCLLIIGGLLGLIISINSMVVRGVSWWWIPVAVMKSAR